MNESQEVEAEQNVSGKSRVDEVVEEVVTPTPVAAPATPIETCEPGVAVRTRRLLTTEQGSGMQGVGLRLTNMLGQPLFAELVDATTLHVIQTFLVMPGDSMQDIARATRLKVVLQTGDVWCGMRSGWRDGKRVEMDEEVELSADRQGTEVLYVSPAKQGGLKVGRAFVENEREQMATQAAAALAVQQSMREEQKRRRTADMAERSSRAAVEPPEPASEPKWRQRRSELEDLAAARGGQDRPRPQAQQERPERLERSERQERAGERQIAGREGSSAQRRMTAAQLKQETGGVELQDWRNLPSRDIRVMVRGKVRMVTGTVGDEDVTFLLSGHSMTTIGEDLAELSGSSGCLRPMTGEGVWKGCLQVIPRIGFGNVQLENVMVVVEPKVRVPILGADLVGRLRMYQGKDGWYLKVGRE